MVDAAGARFPAGLGKALARPEGTPSLLAAPGAGADRPSLDRVPALFVHHQIPEPVQAEPLAIDEAQAADATGKAQGPLVLAVDVSYAEKAALEKLKVATDRCLDAKLQAGVDLARAGFIKKLWGVASAGMVLAAAAMASAVSLGAATPFLAIACVHMAVAVGDAGCAWMTHRNALALQQGADPPFKHVPMAGNCLANLTYPIASRLCSSPESARRAASWTAIALKCGLMAASFSVGIVSPTHLAGAASALKTAGAAMKLALNGYTATHPQNVGKNVAHARELLKKSGESGPLEDVLIKAMVLGRAIPMAPGSAASGQSRESLDKELKRRSGLQFETVAHSVQGLNNAHHLMELAPLELWAEGASNLLVAAPLDALTDAMISWTQSFPPPDAWADGLQSVFTSTLDSLT